MTNDLNKFIRGDESAFRGILTQHQAYIRGRIAGLGVPVAEINSIAQEVFIYVYENIGKFESGSNFKAWINAITRNKVLSFFEVLKRDQRNKARALEFFLLKESLKTRDEENLRLNALKLCLEELGEPLRAQFQKRYSGTALSSIAEELGQSTASLKMSMMRVRAKLKICINSKL